MKSLPLKKHLRNFSFYFSFFISISLNNYDISRIGYPKTPITNLEHTAIRQRKVNKEQNSNHCKFRKYMSAKAYGVTSYYDSVISNWLNVSSDGNKQQPKSWLTSYGKVAMRFPVPTQM